VYILSTMHENLNILLSYLDEQKSIFEKEKASMNALLDTIVQEFRSSVIQISSVVAFIITIVFAMLSVQWIDDVLGQILIVVTIVVSVFLIIVTEFFRNKFLVSKLVISASLDNGLWTISELKRNLFNNTILLERKIDTKTQYLFLFCVICSERVKMITGLEEMLKNKIMKLKASDFSQFYLEYEDIIKKGKTILDEIDETFKKDDSLIGFLKLLDHLRNYKPKS